ncbi:MAG: hypothetical protein ACE5ED_03590 [Rhodothalassiaceae bacterium]
MSLRFALHALAGLFLGLALAAGVQLGFNVLRFLVAPAWLSPAIETRLLGLVGLLAALLVAGPFALAVRRALRRRAWRGLLVATATAVLLDPYFLAALGWTAPAREQMLVRGLALALVALGLARPLIAAAVSTRAYALLALAAILLNALLPRFAFVPVLGGDIETATMAPIHLLVFAKGAVLLVLAATLALGRSPRPVGEVA